MVLTMEDLRKYLEGVKAEIVEYYESFLDEESGEEKSIYDYLAENVLDSEYTIDSNYNYKSCRLYITLGGPTVWIDTREQEIKISWGTEKDAIWLPSEICEEIDSIQEEFYSCR